MSKRKAEKELVAPVIEKRIKTPTKSGHSCDIFLNESPTKLINKVTPSKTLTPSKDFKPSDNKKTPTKDNIQTKSNEGKSETNGLNSQIPSLFVNNNNSSTNTKDPFNSKPNLFANILKSSLPNSGSIFGANPPPTGGLFSGLFDKKLPSEGGLFGSIPTSGGIFGNSTPINSMFGHPEGRSKLSLEKLTSKDSADEDGEEDEECKSPEINADASTGNFKYDELYEKIIIKNYFKAKVNEKNSENGTISLEKGKTQSGSILLILRNQAKLIMEQGNVLKKYTKIGTINKKEESLTITIFKEVQGKLQKKLCKILFLSKKDCTEFKEELEKLI